jgi:hypothetical protein
MAYLGHRLLLALALVFVCPLPVVALEIQTLELTGGSMSFTMFTRTTPGDAHWDITGPRIALSTVQEQQNSGSLFRCTLPPNCSPGATIQVGGSGGGGSFYSGGGWVTLDGDTHGLFGAGGDPRFDGGLVLSLSATVLIPEFGSISSVVLTAPFVLTGKLGRTGLDCFDPFFNPFVCSGDTALSTDYLLHGQGVGEVRRGALLRRDAPGEPELLR